MGYFFFNYFEGTFFIIKIGFLDMMKIQLGKSKNRWKKFFITLTKTGILCFNNPGVKKLHFKC